jgi:hypothetical protein
MSDARRPLAKMATAPTTEPAETKEPFVIRMEPTDIARLDDLARVRRVTRSELVRSLLLHAVEDAEVKELMAVNGRSRAV